MCRQRELDHECDSGLPDPLPPTLTALACPIASSTVASCAVCDGLS
jgi:hypothetical protein